MRTGTSSLRNWWQMQTGVDDTPFDDDMPAWLVSTLAHMGVLIALSFLGGIGPKSKEVELTAVAAVPDPVQEEQLLDTPEEFYFSSTPQKEIGANSDGGGVGAAFGMAPNISEVSAVPSEVQELALEGIPTQAVNNMRLQEEVLIATGPHFSQSLAVRGAAGVGATGAVGAIDRITHEILLSLEERKTLVVWLFDQSGSLEAQRQSVNERFDRIYEELGVIEASGNAAFSKHSSKPLLSSVVAFGQNISTLTPKPTDNVEEIKHAVAGMKTDTSGIEKTFSAVYKSAQDYGPKYRNATGDARRNVMFVVFTDEVGDDQQGLDATVAICRKFEIPVYVVGVPAPFGRKESLIKYMPPKQYQQEVMWVPVIQGPESYQPELVNIGFSGKGPMDEPMDSGFGPYSLTRLCYETGGIFFAVHPNRTAQKAVSRNETALLSAQMTYFFDPEIMRNYRPDYVSTKEYQKLLAENKARGALVQAAALPGVPPFERAETHFPKMSEADLATKLSVAQRTAAVLEPKVNQLYDILKQGEKDRPKLSQPRWQAGYDLAMGRVLAVKVRTESYNAMLAKAKQGMKFKDPKDDTWELAQSDEISVGSALEKQAEQARMYLQRVVKEHKNTPWALLAERELKEPLGWTWKEAYTGVNVPKERPGNAAAAPPPKNDVKNMVKKPVEAPKAPLPKL